MAVQMGFYLALGFYYKAQARFLAHSPSGQPQGKSTGIPKGVEQRWAGAQIVQPLARPSQVVGLFGASVLKMLA
jgi:hypothetical protein